MLGSTMFLLAGENLKVPVYNVEGEKVGEQELPRFFSLPVRKDLIKRAFLAEFTARLQPKGRDPLAGKRTSARSYGVGHGIARVPRIPGLGRAAFINSAVGGMVAHPPRVEKRIREEINKKEKKLATMSALAATAVINMVRARGHRFEAEALPVLLVGEAEEALSRTRDAREMLKKLGLWSDVERAQKGTKIRAGKGKMRGRRYKEPRSILFIVSNHRSPLALATRNLPGVDVATGKTVSVLELAPGGVPGRLTVITLPALKQLEERFGV